MAMTDEELRNMNIARSTLNNMNTGGGGWSNRFRTRTPAQIQLGVDAFDREYTPGQLGPRGPQPGFGKPMPAKNARFNELLFNFLDIINPANRQPRKDAVLANRLGPSNNYVTRYLEERGLSTV
jgi:hypothetical protein